MNIVYETDRLNGSLLANIVVRENAITDVDDFLDIAEVCWEGSVSSAQSLMYYQDSYNREMEQKEIIHKQVI